MTDDLRSYHAQGRAADVSPSPEATDMARRFLADPEGFTAAFEQWAADRGIEPEPPPARWWRPSRRPVGYPPGCGAMPPGAMLDTRGNQLDN